MSERDRGEGNTDAPRVDENEVRTDGNGQSGPRRVKEVRAERETHTNYGSGHAYSDEDGGTSWTSVILGWLTALGAGLILSGIVSGIVGAIFGTAGRQGITEGGATALIGLLITLLVAFLIGGYAAGRMAARSGLKHGLFVPLLALVVTLVLAIIGGLVGVSFIDQLSGVTLAQGAQSSAQQQAAPSQRLGTILSVSGILALLFPFIGGALGGIWGARTGTRRP
ncbi:MAG: hypothetical protein M3341_10140 [Actinomycetota bacterium]|nr:hypothetical protein [Actinomycetota bacterium]